jgi:hypothetical protein
VQAIAVKAVEWSTAKPVVNLAAHEYAKLDMERAYENCIA